MTVSHVDLRKIDPGALHIMWVLGSAGYEARIVGGAVRSLVAGMPINDWDLATTAPPDVVTDVLTAAGMSVHPTGLQHGTVTAVLNDEPYEVTTLRVDVETDGRHAVVEFTTDWVKDAGRRDFTMNAMSIDQDGNLYDYFQGQVDMAHKKICFVGDPVKRIEEDRLRAIRYYRFMLQMGYGNFNSTGAGKTTRSVSNIIEDTYIDPSFSKMSLISGERIWSELKKCNEAFLKSSRMSNRVVLWKLIKLLDIPPVETHGVIISMWVQSFPALIKYLGDALLLVMLVKMHNIEIRQVVFDAYKARLKPSKAEVVGIQWALDQPSPTGDNALDALTIKILLGTTTKQNIAAWIVIHDITISNSKLEALFDLPIPDFPLTGKDMLAAGITGPAIGKALDKARRYWAEANFDPDKEELLLHLQAMGDIDGQV